MDLVTRRSSTLRCAYCHGAFERGVTCEACGSRLHRDCLALSGRCSTLGCRVLDDPARLARRVLRTRRDPKLRIARWAWVSLVTVPALFGGILAALPPRDVVVIRDEPEMMAEADALVEEAMQEYHRWNRAYRQNDDRQARQHAEKACALFTEAVDAYNEVLDSYRDADGLIRPEYEGWEVRLGEISVYLIDLEKYGP